MRVPKHALRSLLIVGIGVTVLAATGCARRVYARPGGTVYVQSAPPPPPQARVSVRPAAPYGGAVWVEGHYQWNGNQYVWVSGHYVQQRQGYVFVQPRWQQQNGRYVYVNGGWAQRRGGRVVHVYTPQRRVVRRRTVRPRVQVRRRGVSVRAPRRGRTGVRLQGRRGTVVVRP